MQKEAKARIRINNLLEYAGWRVFNDEKGPANIALEANVKIKKNEIDQFGDDFMFQLTAEEYKSLRFHFGILEKGQHSKYSPFAFTEQGVAMLSSVLNSERAIEVNIAIMRAFVQLRKMIEFH